MLGLAVELRECASIEEKYAQEGGTSGKLGLPTGEEMAMSRAAPSATSADSVTLRRERELRTSDDSLLTG